ncbi:MAG TPA: aromatic ring-hydroxylating dioxygenase subunit alpha [Steroidobacteraceae bacterium]|nr:aromatic ring-hydroxylating dioxygenase subunit alpha [Steroidobacteraceae bacterium]
MAYLRNAWYVAAMHDELPAGKLLARTYLDEPIVLFRTSNGQPRALADRCPHRFAPLSQGILCDGGNAIQCGYHGLKFDGDGTCVHSPQGPAPKAATVKRFVVRERDGLIWLWAGAAADADDSLIPDFSRVTRAPPEATVRGYLSTGCGYELFVDNILDLTHADFVHRGSLGSGALSRSRPQVADPSARSVRIAWHSSGDAAPPAFDVHLRERNKPTDQWTEVTWMAPSLMLLRVGATLQGEPQESGADSLSLHLGTPESADRTHYWYWTTRTFARTAADNAMIKPLIEHAFMHEDKPMLEAQQLRIGTADFWNLNPVLLPGDAGAVRVRRKLQSLIESETSAANRA